MTAAPLRVFVMGCSRGGTTLTQRLVAERLDLLTLPETRFFANLIGNLDRRMFPRTRRPRTLRQRIGSELREALGRGTSMAYHSAPGIEAPRPRRWASVGATTAGFTAALDRMAREAGAAGWLEKTPFHVHYAPQIARLVPDAWMVHVIRDARETVASLCDVARRHPGSWGITYDQPERAADNWNAATAASAAMVGAPRQVFVPYAALAAAPDAVMSEVLTRMGGAGTETRPPRSMAATDLAMAREEWKAGALDGPVAPALSKWETALTTEERARVAPMLASLPPALEAEMAPFRRIADAAKAPS